MDNGTMVESFKFLNYCQLATNSLVSKRFWNLIRTQRHKLALLDGDQILMNSYIAYQHQPFIKIFNEGLSPEEYNKLIVCNGYSKQVPLDSQISGKENTENDRDIYQLSAKVHPDPNHCHDTATAVFYAQVELKDATWPLFQHFFRLLMDPFIYIRSLSLYSLKVFTLLAEAMKPDRDQLQCKKLFIGLNDDSQKSIIWMKNHVRCDEFEIFFYSESNYDEELLDLFLTGAPCTSAINIIDYDLSKVVVNLMQNFMDLKNRDEYQMVESIRGYVRDQGIVEKLKRNVAECIIEEEKYNGGRGIRQVIGFINNDIEKKLTLNAEYFSYGSPFSIKITNL